MAPDHFEDLNSNKCAPQIRMAETKDEFLREIDELLGDEGGEADGKNETVAENKLTTEP